MFVNSYTLRHIHRHTPRLPPSHITHSFHIVTLTPLDSHIHNPQMHTNSHTHRSIHTHTQYIHIHRPHAHNQLTCTFTDSHAFTLTDLHTLMPTHPCTLIHIHILTHAYRLTQPHTLIHIHYSRSHLYPLVDTLMHTHTCAHSHSLSLLVLYSPTHIKQSLPDTLAH